MDDRLGRRCRRPLGSLLLAALVAGLLCVWVPPTAAEPEVTCERLETLSETGRPQRTLELLDESGQRCPGLRAEARALRKGARALMKLARRLEEGTPRVVSQELPAFACVDTLPATPAKARAAANTCDHRVRNVEEQEPESEPPARECADAAKLNDAGYPSAAEALITRLKLTCPQEEKEAIARQERAAALIAWVLTDASDRPGKLPAARSAPCATEDFSEVKDALEGARSCDREAAKLPDAAEVADPGTLTNISNHWTLLIAGLGPFWKIAAGLLMWIAVCLALAKAAIWLVRNGRIGTRRSHAWWWIGFGCLVAGGAAAMVAASSDTSGWLWVVAGVVSLAGVVLVAEFWRTQPRLAVWSSNEDAVASSAVATIARELGTQGPSGIQVPNGPDASFVDSVGLNEWSDNAAVNALKVVAELLKPVNPWRLELDAVDQQRLRVTLSRNRTQVGGVRVFSTGEHLGHVAQLPAPAGAPTLDLAAFPAAHAITEMAREHGEDGENGEMAGATSAVSVAQQYLGARLDRTDPRRLLLFQRAVGSDAENQTAWLSYLHDLYREETDEKKLLSYRELIPQHLPNAAGEPGTLVTETEARARLARLAAGINAGVADLRDEAEQLERAADGLCAASIHEAAKREFAEDFKIAAKAMAASVREPSDPPHAPETLGAAANYSWGCYWATHIPDDEKAHARKVREDRAVEFLRRADSDPQRKAWKRRDPQLRDFRRTRAYAEAFGAESLFELAPARDRKEALHAAGLTSVESVAAAPPEHLEALGIKGAEAMWLQALAKVWRSDFGDVAPWRGELVRVLSERGWPPVPRPKGAGPDELKTVVPDDQTLQDALAEWWKNLEPSPPG